MKRSRLKRWNDSSGAWRRLAAAMAVTGLLSGATAHAVEFGGGMAQLHGFASQTFITTSDNNFFGDTSDNGHFGFTELGLNGSFRPSPNLQAAAQLLSRRAGEDDDGDVRFDYALVDYSPLSDARNRLGLRAGRIMNPLGLYNDTRDVAFTRPSIFLPQSIYFDRTRDLALSADGVHVYGEHRFDRSELFWQLGVVRPRVKHPEIERAVLRTDRPGSLEPDTSYVGRLLWELDGGMVRLAVSAAQANMNYDPNGDPLGDGSIRFTPVIYSFQYNREDWSFTTEYARRSFDLRDFNVANTTVVGESAYVQGIWRLSDDWNVLLRYDALYVDKDDRYGNTVPVGTPSYSRYAQDATVGLGWNATPSLLVRAEYHQVKGTAWLPALDNPDPADTKEHWNMFAILASYRF